MPEDPTQALCRRVAAALQSRGLWLTTAESCTGGGLACALTRLPGSSAWFDGGFVTYSNAAKQALLGVQSSTLSTHGAVSEHAAAELATGALVGGRADIACSITGIAGPGGGSTDKPVGTVCFGWARADRTDGATRHTQTTTRRLFGDRDAVREQAIRIALRGVLALLPP